MKKIIDINRMLFQLVAAYMMIDTLNKKGYNGFAVSLPSVDDIMEIFKLAAPVFVVMMSKVYCRITQASFLFKSLNNNINNVTWQLA